MENRSTAVLAASSSEPLITPQVVHYVEKYRTFVRKTAESVIALATTLVEAEQVLNGVDFSIFCDEVGIKKGDATYSKLKKIGENATRFRPHLERLPNAWTTLYQLAKMEPDRFAQVAPTLTPFSTADDISRSAGANEKNKSKDTIDLTISFKTMGSDAKKDVYAAILEMQKRYAFSIKEGHTFISEMKKLKQRKAA